MCIALVSTLHPAYSLIVIDNRDVCLLVCVGRSDPTANNIQEFLRRPTSSPDWWPEPSSFVLGSRDLARATHGTWMGVTKQGKVAVLTNYREDTAIEAIGQYSRGRIVNSWLTSPPREHQTTHDFVQSMVASPEAKQVGGFSLICGHINEPLAIVSNRSSDMDHITWVASERNQTRGLSNTSVDDRSWPKIIHGERLMQEAIEGHVQSQEDEEALLERFLAVLSTDTLPQLPGVKKTLDNYVNVLRESIFVPVIGSDETPDQNAEQEVAARGPLDQNYSSGPYGTQKQTILLARPDGRVRYFERTLYDDKVNAVPVGQGDRSFEFHVEP